MPTPASRRPEVPPSIGAQGRRITRSPTLHTHRLSMEALAPTDDVMGPAAAVVVIGHDLWQRRFGGSAEGRRFGDRHQRRPCHHRRRDGSRPAGSTHGHHRLDATSVDAGERVAGAVPRSPRIPRELLRGLLPTTGRIRLRAGRPAPARRRSTSGRDRDPRFRGEVRGASRCGAAFGVVENLRDA